MRLLFLSILLCCLSSLASAADSFPLSLDLVNKFREASVEVEAATDKYPALEESDIELELLINQNGSGLVDRLRSHGAYDDLNQVVKGHGFASITQYVELMSRLITALSAIEFAKQSPEQLAQIENMDLAAMRQQLLASGAPAEMVESQLEMVEKMVDMAKKMKTAADAVDPKDLAFVEANYEAVSNAVRFYQ